MRSCLVLLLASACTALPFGPVDDTDSADAPAPEDTAAFGDTAEPGEDGETGDAGADDTDVADTDSPPAGAGTVLSFRQYVSFWTSYLSEGSHQVLVGPDDGSSPYGGTWVVVLDAAAMEAAAADRSWELTSVDLGPTLAAEGWTSFRLGFRYTGESADSWYLDDLCIGPDAAPVDLAGCTRLAEALDSYSFGELPVGWETVAGPANEKLDGWALGSTGAPSYSPSRSIARTWSADLVDQVLVVPVP